MHHSIDLYDTAVVNVSCNGGSDGSITTTLQNGNLTPYTYQWSYQAAATSSLNIPAGTYHVTVTDANGCRVYGPQSYTCHSAYPYHRYLRRDQDEMLR
jgi:hypothetical protein